MHCTKGSLFVICFIIEYIVLLVNRQFCKKYTIFALHKRSKVDQKATVGNLHVFPCCAEAWSKFSLAVVVAKQVGFVVCKKVRFFNHTNGAVACFANVEHKQNAKTCRFVCQRQFAPKRNGPDCTLRQQWGKRLFRQYFCNKNAKNRRKTCKNTCQTLQIGI